MKKLLVTVIVAVMMVMLVTACNNKEQSERNDNGMYIAIVGTGMKAAEENQIVWIRQSFLTDNRLRSVKMAIESRDYRKAHGELVTSIKVEEDEDWPGWYRAWFMSTIAE